MWWWWWIAIFLWQLTVCAVASMTLNVGTALFRDMDDARDCWAQDELALLRCRRVMQDLVPARILTDSDDDDDAFVPALVEYFEMCVCSVWDKARGRARHLLLLALADAFGGFLHVYALPFTKERYYAGAVRYDYLRRLYDLYDDLKAFLMTDGGNWRRPRKDLRRGLRIQPLPMPTEGNACADLIVRHGEGEDKVTIPLPILDEGPSVVAMPFKGSGGLSLLNLKSPRSAFVLVRYYQDSRACLAASAHKSDAMDAKYLHWLRTQVVPHLKDDAWYAGFGGVLRILRTLPYQEEDEEEGNEPPLSVPPQEEEVIEGHVQPEEEEVEAWYRRTSALVSVAGSVAAILLLTCCLVGVVYRRRRKKRSCDDPECGGGAVQSDSSSRLFNSVVQVMYSLRTHRSKEEVLQGESIDALPPMLEEGPPPGTANKCPMTSARCQRSSRRTPSSQEGDDQTQASNKDDNTEISSSDDEDSLVDNPG